MFHQLTVTLAKYLASFKVGMFFAIYKEEYQGLLP